MKSSRSLRVLLQEQQQQHRSQTLSREGVCVLYRLAWDENRLVSLCSPQRREFIMNNLMSLYQLEQEVETLLLGMDPELTKEYLRALEIIPERARAEAKIADFLRTENYQPVTAASRLCRYWKVRKFLFGDRW